MARKRNGSTVEPQPSEQDIRDYEEAVADGTADAVWIEDEEDTDVAKRNGTTNGTVEQEQTVETPEPRLCECGCGETVKGKKARFVVGHDAKLKGRLLAAFDAGDESAGATLVANGWKSEADLAARRENAATKHATTTGTKRERLVARIDRAKAEVERLEAELAALAG